MIPETGVLCISGSSRDWHRYIDRGLSTIGNF